MISRKGVCYDLEVSRYRHTVDGITYVFSSELHRGKFITRLHENREAINTSLSKRFNVPVNVPQLADLVLYKKVETRGFLIVTSEGMKLWQNEAKYHGGKVIPQQLKEQ